MDYINFVDINNKKIYDLGKRIEAKCYLPYLANKYADKPIVLFGDETHCYLENTYERREFGGEYEECSMANENWKDFDISHPDAEMSLDNFNEVFNKIGGKIISNLQDYV